MAIPYYCSYGTVQQVVPYRASPITVQYSTRTITVGASGELSPTGALVPIRRLRAV